VYTRSLATAERAARRSVSVEILAYSCTNTANRSRVSLGSTFSNCHVLFRYLHSCIHASLQQLSHSEHAMPCVSSTDFPTTNVVYVNWAVTVTNQRLLPLLSLTTPRIDLANAPSWTRTTVADGHKFSAVRRLSRRLLDRS